jgi:D-serine deaminase-like pyridoxal phosphate-dependent protein
VTERLSDLPTPCLVLERARLATNIERMAGRARTLGVALRPHLKTCKSVDIAALAAPERSRVTVSTLQEARYFAAAGFKDLLYAVGIAPQKLAEVDALNRGGARVQLLLDAAETARAVAAEAERLGTRFELWIEVDVDGHRAGLLPDDPELLQTGRLVHQSARLFLRGVLTHAGEAYHCRTAAELRAHAEQERSRCVQAAGALRAAGVPCPEVSVGSTPTALSASSLEGVTELRAGVYVFQDLFQAGLGVCRVEDIALSVLATVIGHKRSHRRLIVDAGGLALSKDRGTAEQPVDRGYGLVARARDGAVIPGLRVAACSQEHGVIELPGSLDFDAFPVGSRLRILPNHACMTAAAHERYHVVDGDDRVLACWPRCNFW